MLNPIHLNTLHMVLRLGSFRDAGMALGYTGSAVSQQISALERRLGVTLFDREAHRVTPTPTARFVAEHSAEALGRLQQVENDIESYVRGEIGSLRLGAFQSVSERLLPAALAAFRKQHPHVEMPLLEDTPANLIPRLRTRELDLAVLYRYNSMRSRWPRDYPAEHLFTEEHFILAPVDHQIARETEPVTLQELSTETWISTGAASTGTAMLRKLCDQAGFEPTITYQSYNYATVQGLVAAGLGIALVPALGYTPAPGIAAVTVHAPDSVREVHVMRSPSLLDAPWQSMSKALRRAAATLAESAVGISLPQESARPS